MLIYTERIGQSDRWLFWCSECGRELGTIGTDEVEGIVNGDSRVICFDCEGVGADVVPDHLLLECDPYYLFLGKGDDQKVFKISWTATARELQTRLEWWKAFADRVGRWATCLSSSTKRNKGGS